MAKYKYTRRVRDKFGYIWLRDRYGGWTNEWGVRFTKTEHRRFGYEIAKANRQIRKYQEQFPLIKEQRSTSVGDRLRRSDLGRFRSRGAYRRYLRTTRQTASGYILYKKQPNQYRTNLKQALRNEYLNDLKRDNPYITRLINKIDKELNKMTYNEITRLARNVRTPDINIYYVKKEDVSVKQLEQLLEVINSI